MPVVNDDGKRYRVMRWLEDLRACSARLAETRGAIAELEARRDGIGGVRYNPAKVSATRPMADTIGETVARCDQRLAELKDDAAMLEAATRNAGRTIRAAWEANRGVADACFEYVVRRYAGGEPMAEAARHSGLGKYEAAGAARKVAAMIYDSSPRLFAAPVDGTGDYGYWEFARREGGGRHRRRA